MRKALLVVGIVAAILVVFLVAVVLLVDVNRYRGVIQSQLERQLGRKVTLGTISLGFIPLRLQVQNPVIAEDAAFGTERPFLRAEKLDVRLSLSSLLKGNVDIQSVELQRPSLELVRNKSGAWNASTLGGASSPPSPPGGASDQQGSALSIDLLSIRDGQTAMTDLQHPQARTIYDHIDLATQLANRSGVFAAKGNLKLNAAR